MPFARSTWALERLLVAAVLVVACGSEDGPYELSVDLRTDLRPGVEFTAIRTEAVEASRRVDTPATADQDYLAGVRIAELGGLSASNHTIDVTLRDAEGAEVLTRRVRVDLDGDRGMVVVITGECLGVSCPGSGEPAEATECLAGRCVPVTCVEAGSAGCEDVACASNGDCATGAACQVAECVESTCLYRGDDAACGVGEYCGASGCAGVPGGSCEEVSGVRECACPAGETCRFSCDAAASSCVSRCSEFSDCMVECASASCSIECDLNADRCQLQCPEGSDCAVTCLMGGSCGSPCTNPGGCTGTCAGGGCSF